MEAMQVGAGGHGRRRAAMSPVVRPAATVGEPGIFAVVTHDRTLAGLGPLPNPKRGLAFVLSGYVLSWKFIEQGDHAYLRASALKQFPRLVAPVFASVLFAWALLTLGVMRTTEAAAIGAASFLSEAYNQPVSLMSALWIGAIGAPLLGQTTINVPLWTIKIELLGSFLLFAVYAMSGSKSPLLALAAFFILLIGFIPGSANIVFFSGFIAGSLLHYIKPPIGGRIWLSLALIIAGLIAGGFDYSPLYY